MQPTLKSKDIRQKHQQAGITRATSALPAALGLRHVKLFIYLVCPVPPPFFFFPLSFLGPHLRHMEVPRLGVESELQLPTYTTAHGNMGSLEFPSWLSG